MSSKEKKPLVIEPEDQYPIQVAVESRRFLIDDGGLEVEARFDPTGTDSHVQIFEPGSGDDSGLAMDISLSDLDRLIQLLMHAHAWLERKINLQDEKKEKSTKKVEEPAAPTKPAAPVFGFSQPAVPGPGPIRHLDK